MAAAIGSPGRRRMRRACRDVAAAVGRADVFASLDYGEGSDTWSANPLCCAAVLATLEEFEGPRYQRIGHIRKLMADGVIDESLRHIGRAAA